MAVSITPAQVMMAVTNPAPAAIEYVDTLRAPGMFFARLAEIEPAAIIMPVNRKTLVQRGLFSSKARICLLYTSRQGCSYGDQGPGKRTLTLLAAGRRGVLSGC